MISLVVCLIMKFHLAWCWFFYITTQSHEEFLDFLFSMEDKAQIRHFVVE